MNDQEIELCGAGLQSKLSRFTLLQILKVFTDYRFGLHSELDAKLTTEVVLIMTKRFMEGSLGCIVPYKSQKLQTERLTNVCTEKDIQINK